MQRTFAFQLQQAVEQVGHIAQVAEEVADTTLHQVGGDVAVAIDDWQKHPLIEAVVEVVDPAIPGLQRVIDLQRAEARALELALIEAWVDLQMLHRLLEAVVIGCVLCLDQAAGEDQACEKRVMERLSHGRTPAWRRC